MTHPPRFRPGHAPWPGLSLLFSVAGAAILGLSGCGGNGGLDDSTRAEVVALGDSAAMTLVRTLGGRLNGALAEGGADHAIGFCAGEAQALTDSVSRSLGPGWEVKRTSMRTRNPRNAPDSLEAVALGYFHEAEAAARRQDDPTRAPEGPPALVQRTAAGDFRYYMPLRLGHMCLQCHGEAAELDAGVREVLQARYPADQATGYAEGDLRGLIRVTVPRTALR